MRNVYLAISAAALMGHAGMSQADLVVNFDTAANWTAGAAALTSYASNHTYLQSGLTFTGGNALRQTTATQDGFAGAFGTYAWRLQDNSAINWTATYSTVQPSNELISGFSFAVRRWDATPDTNFTVAYSLNGGSTFTSVGTINNASLGNSSNWSTFTSGTLPPTVVGNGAFVVRLTALAGSHERIMVDNFSVTAAAVPEASAFLYGGLIVTGLYGWRWRQKRRVEQVLA
jgi:hypothetical protein